MPVTSPIDAAGSLLDPECPMCGATLKPERGWIWRCARCDFRAECCGGVLLELSDRHEAGGTSAS